MGVLVRCVGEVCRWGCWIGVLGRCVVDGMMLKCERRAGCRQLAPLYYPDTLVNPDTCLGKKYSKIDFYLYDFIHRYKGNHFQRCIINIFGQNRSK